MVYRSPHFLSLKRTQIGCYVEEFPGEDARARCVVQPRLWLANGWREIKGEGMCGRVGRRNALNRADTSRRMMRFLATRLIYLVGASIVVLTLNAVDASEKFSSEIAETNQTTMASLGWSYYPNAPRLTSLNIFDIAAGGLG